MQRWLTLFCRTGHREKRYYTSTGAYHSNNFEGISWYLKKQNPVLKILTISSVELENVLKPGKENKDLATYVLAIPADMTKTY